MNTIREKIFQKNDIKREKVYIDEWDVSLFVRGMSGIETASFMEGQTVETAQNMEVGEGFKRLVKVVIQCAEDENESRIFNEADIEALSGKNINALTKLSDKVFELTGLTGDNSKN